jgi:RNA polymerase-binding transcription factor DksA
MANETTSAAPKQQRTDLDLEHFRQRLQEEKALAEETIAGVRSQEADNLNETGTNRAELTDQDENHPADEGTELFLREEDMALVANARVILGKIVHAFEKLEQGTYGVSDHSGKPIPVERLEAVPYANLLTDEQEIMESGGLN